MRSLSYADHSVHAHNYSSTKDDNCNVKMGFLLVCPLHELCEIEFTT